MLERLRILKRTDRTVLQVLETHIFHSFLKDRLNRKMDSFARMELSTRSEMQKYANFFNLISIEVTDNIRRGTNLGGQTALGKTQKHHNLHQVRIFYRDVAFGCISFTYMYLLNWKLKIYSDIKL